MPKTHNNLYAEIVSFDNLWHAYHSARKGKRDRREVAHFSANLEENLLNIHNHLVWGSWKPGKAREFRIFEPKQRDIQAPPFADRVVHHAMVRVLEPLFERRFIHHSYACRTGKGSQRAVRAVQSMIREQQRSSIQPYIVKSDIRRYFASIVHSVLFRSIRQVISCARTLALWEVISFAYGHEDGIGLPVGALTSQLSANILLDQLDHAMTDDAGVAKYVRYMDDAVMVVPNKEAAHAVLIALSDEVAGLSLELNPKTRIFPAHQGVDFCGYRVWSTHVLPRRRNIKKARIAFRALRAKYADGRISLRDVNARVSSYLAYAKHCDSHGTTKHLLSDLILNRNPKGNTHECNH